LSRQKLSPERVELTDHILMNERRDVLGRLVVLAIGSNNFAAFRTTDFKRSFWNFCIIQINLMIAIWTSENHYSIHSGLVPADWPGASPCNASARLFGFVA